MADLWVEGHSAVAEVADHFVAEVAEVAIPVAEVAAVEQPVHPTLSIASTKHHTPNKQIER